MGFGSGGGGFTPSPNNVPGSTQTGTDKDTDLHQFTGSVDITGSLTLNGSSITSGGGGGGGAVSSYTNSGNNRVITSVNSNTINGEANLTFDGTKMGVGSNHTPTAVLHVSSSTTTLPLLRVDQHDQAGAKPILYVTGSGLVAIGTDSPRTDTGDTNRLHILGESGGDQGVNPAVNSVLVLENNDHAGLNIITPADKSGMLVFGDPGASNRAYFRYAHGTSGGGPVDRFIFDGTFAESVMTIRRDGDSINIGQNNADHMLTNKAALHISSSTGGTDIGGPVLLRVDHADQPGAEPTLFVTGSGRVGIGTAAPETPLEVRSTTTQQKWSYDDDHEFTVTVGSNGETVLAVSGTTVAGLGSSDLALDVSKGGDIFFRRAGDRLRFGISTGDTFIQTDNQNTDLVFRMHPDGGLGAVGTEVARFDASGAGALLMSGTISSPGGNAPINFRDTANSIHSPGSNRLALTSPALEVSGSTRMSGAFGSTAVETLTAAGTISATTGLTIIDASSSLAVNNTLNFTIANGTFVGQEKKIRAMIKSGSTGPLSTGIAIGGANIDSAGDTPVGQIVLSGNLPDNGPIFHRAGCSLIWGGTKWLPVGNFNFNINNTGRSFI